jgi:hypothetical protein
MTIQLGLVRPSSVVCDGINCGEVIRPTTEHDAPTDKHFCQECSLTVCLDCGRQGCMCSEYEDAQGFVSEVLR